MLPMATVSLVHGLPPKQASSTYDVYKSMNSHEFRSVASYRQGKCEQGINRSRPFSWICSSDLVGMKLFQKGFAPLKSKKSSQLSHIGDNLHSLELYCYFTVYSLYKRGSFTEQTGEAELFGFRSSNLLSTRIDSRPTTGERDILGVLYNNIFARRSRSSWVCFGGGKRPRQPRVWKTKQRIGTVSKSDNLLKLVESLSHVKEEVYGALDGWIAWELEFPLIAVKKALRTLKVESNWRRIIQISKWMLSKGQGKTMGTYGLLMEALDKEKRFDEAEELWKSLFERHMEFLPRRFWAHMISIYQRSGSFDKLLDVFADMEELGVQPDQQVVHIVAETYLKIGMLDKQEKVLKKYPPPARVYKYVRGKRIRMLVRQGTQVSGKLPVLITPKEDVNRDETSDYKRVNNNFNSSLDQEVMELTDEIENEEVDDEDDVNRDETSEYKRVNNNFNSSLDEEVMELTDEIENEEVDDEEEEEDDEEEGEPLEVPSQYEGYVQSRIRAILGNTI